MKRIGRTRLRAKADIITRIARGIGLRIGEQTAWTMRFIAARSKRVPDPAYPWLVTDGPWFDNCLAEATIQGPDVAIVWRGGTVRGGDDLHPVLTTIGAVRIPGGHGAAGTAGTGVGDSSADERHTVTP